MNWSERMIARALARQTFNRQHLVVVPNCTWTGNECDLLVVTENLRIIDVEIKISRADLKADAKKYKWWQTYTKDPVTGRHKAISPPLPRNHPVKVWKHYYAIPKEIWKPDLLECLPSPDSGVILLFEQRNSVTPLAASVERRAKPCRDAHILSPAAAIDIARLASLRMWDAYLELERTQAKQRLELAA